MGSREAISQRRERVAALKGDFVRPLSELLRQRDRETGLVRAEPPCDRGSNLEVRANFGSRPGARVGPSKARQDLHANPFRRKDAVGLHVALAAQSAGKAVI